MLLFNSVVFANNEVGMRPAGKHKETLMIITIITCIVLVQNGDWGVEKRNDRVTWDNHIRVEKKTIFSTANVFRQAMKTSST